MIEKICIRGVASYSDENEQVIEPKEVNFLFGLNGSGKTTISRYIASPDEEKYSKCQIKKTDSDLNCYVYNQDYVKDNFSAATIPGVFTLGKDSIETQTKREKLAQEIEELEEIISKKTKEIDSDGNSPGYKQMIKQLEEEYSNRFWRAKQSLDHEKSSMKDAISGVLGSKERFKERLLDENESNKSELLDKALLENRSQQLFGTAVERIDFIPVPTQFDAILSLEKSDVLYKVIVGKENVAIAELIKRLDNSAWFSAGRQYLALSNGKCPFCQQVLPEGFTQQIADYFDETYKANIAKISSLKNDYNSFANQLLQQIKHLLDKPNKFLDTTKLSNLFVLLEKRLKSNIEKIRAKELTPSSIVELDSIMELSTIIKEYFQETNNTIREHNERIDNIKNERKKLTSEVWKYIVTQLSLDISDYNAKKKKYQHDLLAAEKEKQDATISRQEKISELHKIEQGLTSIVPTANGINSILKNYGFNSFKLVVDDQKLTYQFVRANNEPAFETLSEGERNFVTFLYYIYSLKGNIDKSGHKEKKVLVIDDPVSSLDSDVLFVVSSLIRDLFQGVYHDDSTDGIKQIFILSHNLYFFKEVSYKAGINKSKTRYWIISKFHEVSRIESHDTNPVSSTYEMLWEEVIRAQNNPTNFNTVTLANAMRRILEYYFSFLGGKELNMFHRDFQDGERQVFKSLISWANAGSHSEFDDFSVAPALYNADSFLNVFKKLFELSDHISHYRMMMRIENTPNNTEEPAHE